MPPRKPAPRKRKAKLPEAFQQNIERVRSGELKPKGRKKAAPKKKTVRKK